MQLLLVRRGLAGPRLVFVRRRVAERFWLGRALWLERLGRRLFNPTPWLPDGVWRPGAPSHVFGGAPSPGLGPGGAPASPGLQGGGFPAFHNFGGGHNLALADSMGQLAALRRPLASRAAAFRLSTILAAATTLALADSMGQPAALRRPSVSGPAASRLSMALEAAGVIMALAAEVSRAAVEPSQLGDTAAAAIGEPVPAMPSPKSSVETDSCRPIRPQGRLMSSATQSR